MVQQCCLSAHRTRLSSPSLQSLLSPTRQSPRCLLCRRGLRLKKSYIWHPSGPPTSITGLLSPPSPHQHLPPSAPWTWAHPFISPTCNPSQPPPELSPLSLADVLQDPFSWHWYRAHHRKKRTSQAPPVHRLGPPTAYSPGAPKQSGTYKTVWRLCLQLFFIVFCLTTLSATSLLLSSLAAPSIYHTGAELWRHACRQLSLVPPPAGLLLWVYFRVFPKLPWLP